MSLGLTNGDNLTYLELYVGFRKSGSTREKDRVYSTHSLD